MTATAHGVGGWVNTTFDSLRNRNYRILWTGTALSFIAFMMSMTGQSVVAFDLSGSNQAVGAVQFGQGAAMLALAPFAGAMADRLSKRLVILFCQTVIGLLMLAIAILIYTSAISVLFLAAASFLMGTMFAFLGPARQAYLGELVEPERRGNAVALQQVAMNATRVVGPFLVGGLLAWRVTGSGGTFLVIAAIFTVVVATTFMLPPTTGRGRGAGPSLWRDITLGINHITQNPRLLPLVVGFVLVVMTGFSYMTVMPAFTEEELGVGTAGLGALLGVAAAGGLIVSLAFASLADSPRAPLLLLLSSAGLGAGLILTGLAPTFAVAAVTMLGVGAGSSGFQTLNNAQVMREADPAYYGRVMSITMLAWSGTGLMALPVGLFADAVGERGALMTMGAGVCAVTALLALWAARAGARRPLAVSPLSGGAGDEQRLTAAGDD